jgi:ketosteroid isomerase-like protein
MTTEETIRAYLRAIESHDLDAVAAYLHADYENIEHPNKLSPQGKRFDKAGARAAGERGAAIIASERYEVRSVIAEGPRAAVQLVWSGTLGAAAGPRAGETLVGQICSVIELRDGLIWRQEQYDCFPS